jgi:type IV pilus assembly protein PilQ
MTKMRMWGVAAALVVATTLVSAGAAPEQGPPVQTSAQALRSFSTTLIDVDYQSASLRTVLRQLAEIGGANLVVDASVPNEAVIDLKLNQVPWYQVMDVVMRSGGLTYEQDGNVLRVLTQAARKVELSTRNETQEASKKVLLSDLPTARIRLNYASSVDVAKLLTDLKFTADNRAAVQSEPRTNMLIIQASTSDIAQIREIVSDIDRPEPQVEIEARIVQTLNTTLKEIGINWNFGGDVSPALGNTTGLAFPNSGSLRGGTNLPTPNTSGSDPLGSGLGLAMGAINGAFNLDIALRALETEGQVKVISTPRITTQNNQLAEVTQGVEIPYQVVTTTGGVQSTSIQFKDAALKLLVTPKITPANTVIMRIQLENGSPSDVLGSEQAGPSIRTDRANTLVQVADGMTTVIGGILATDTSSDTSRTPGLSKVPLLGWLFKNQSSSTQSRELVIFITPRIIRG